MRPSGSSPAARPPLRHRRRPALAGEGPSLARPTPSLASPPLAGEAHALASEGPSPARVKALAGEAPRQRGPSPRWRGCPRQRGPRPRQRERVRFLMDAECVWREEGVRFTCRIVCVKALRLQALLFLSQKSELAMTLSRAPPCLTCLQVHTVQVDPLRLPESALPYGVLSCEYRTECCAYRTELSWTCECC